MTRKRAIKLLVSVSRAGNRTEMEDVMRDSCYFGKTNAEKVDDILRDFTFVDIWDGKAYIAFRALNLRERLKGGGRK